MIHSPPHRLWQTACNWQECGLVKICRKAQSRRGVPEDGQARHGSGEVQLRPAVRQLLFRGQVEQLPGALLCRNRCNVADDAAGLPLCHLQSVAGSCDHDCMRLLVAFCMQRSGMQGSTGEGCRTLCLQRMPQSTHLVRLHGAGRRHSGAPAGGTPSRRAPTRRPRPPRRRRPRGTALPGGQEARTRA